MATIAEALALALQHHQSGKLVEAERIYRQILQAVPNEPDAWHRLGLLACQAGNATYGIDAIRRAIAINPLDAAYHNNLGLAYQSLGRTEEALASHRQAVKVNRNWPDGHFSLGVALARANRLPEAVAALTEAARLVPQRAEPQNELGIVLARLGRMEEAANSFRQATRLKPDYAEAHNNLGNVRVAQGRLEEAVGRYRKALEFRPNYYQAHAHLGVALSRQGRTDESIECLEHAVQLEPSSADARNNLGNALLTAGRLPEAQSSFEMALKLNPDFVPAVSNYLLLLNYDPAIDSQRLADEHRTWAARLEKPASGSLGHENTPDPEHVRVGYVSADFRRHPVGSFIMPVLTHGNRPRVTSILFADVHVPDAMTGRFESLADAWHNTTGMSTEQLAELVRQERIDILVDLGGHTSGNRLGVFGLKPAPVQVSYIGYPTTTGLTTIDYQVTDAMVDHPGDEQFYSELLVRLPGGFSCYTPPEGAPDVNLLPAGSTGRVTFGALHNLAKLNRQVLELWARVVRQVPGSRLIIARDVLTGGIAKAIADQLIASGLQPDDFELRHEFPAGGHLALYREIDIGLDAFPWSGHTTACEALWMGVPTVSMVGHRHAGRMVASAFSQAGMQDWLAADADQYVAIAQRAASDLDSLAALRRELRQRVAASPLCDAAQFVGELEDAYRGMWTAWCRQRG